MPYAAYPRFQRLMAEESGAVHDAALVDAILPLMPGLPARLAAGIEVADVGCGSGHAVNLMARAFPNSRFVGYDFLEEGVQVGRDEAGRLGLDNARFEARDVTDLGERQRFDLITALDAIHDQAKSARVLSSIAEALRADGVFLMVDNGHPVSASPFSGAIARAEDHPPKMARPILTCVAPSSIATE